MGFWENVKRFNERWNDLPRRGAIVLMVLLALLAFAGLFSYIAPSVIAMVLAWVIHPVARRLENVFRKIKLPARLASLIAVIVMYGIVSFILFWIGARVVEELRSLIAALPGWVSQASDFIQKWSAEGGFQTFGVEMFGWQVFDVPPEITDFINAVVNEGLEFVKNFSLSMVGTVSNWTISTVMNLPQIILFIVLTIMGTFYMVADRKRIFAFFERWIPQRATGKLKLLKDTVFRGIAGQIKSALIMMALIAVELSVGFVILRVPYSVLLALLICALLHGWANRDMKIVLLAALSLAIGKGAFAAVAAWYGKQGGVDFRANVSMLARLAMGMQESPVAAGWYNKYIEQFFAADVTAQQEKEQALAAIGARLGWMRENPAAALAFYREKLLTQWLDPAYDSLWMGELSEKVGRYNGLIGSIYRRKDGLRTLMDGYMDAMQTAVYALSAVGGARLLKKKDGMTALALPVTILGGTLYHLLFEAKAQYAYPYMVYMLPLAAVGLCTLAEKLKKISG